MRKNPYEYISGFLFFFPIHIHASSTPFVHFYSDLTLEEIINKMKIIQVKIDGASRIEL